MGQAQDERIPAGSGIGVRRFGLGVAVGVTLHLSIAALAWIWASGGDETLRDERVIPWVAAMFATWFVMAFVSVVTQQASLAWGVVIGSGVAIPLELLALALSLAS